MYQYVVAKVNVDENNIPEPSDVTYSNPMVLSYVDDVYTGMIVNDYLRRSGADVRKNVSVIILRCLEKQARGLSDKTIVNMLGMDFTQETLVRMLRIFDGNITYSSSLPDAIIKQIVPPDSVTTFSRREMTVTMPSIRR